jgi:hypothetical protein
MYHRPCQMLRGLGTVFVYDLAAIHEFCYNVQTSDGKMERNYISVDHCKVFGEH